MKNPCLNLLLQFLMDRENQASKANMYDEFWKTVPRVFSMNKRQRIKQYYKNAWGVIVQNKEYHL